MNAATRLLEVLSRIANGCNGANTAGAAMFKVLEIDAKSSPHDQDDELNVGLQAIRGEIDLVMSKLRDRSVPSKLFENQLNHFKSVLSARSMNGQIQGLHGMSNGAELRAILGWAEFTLADEEDVIGTADLVEIAARIAELEVELAGVELPKYTREFLAKQLAAMRRALWLYKVAGAAAIQEASEKVSGSYQRHKAAIESELKEATPEVRSFATRAANAITQVSKLANAADKVNKAWDAGTALFHHMAPLLEAAGRAIQ